jgi:hypothetical protein
MKFDLHPQIGEPHNSAVPLRETRSLLPSSCMKRPILPRARIDFDCARRGARSVRSAGVNVPSACHVVRSASDCRRSALACARSAMRACDSKRKHSPSLRTRAASKRTQYKNLLNPGKLQGSQLKFHRPRQGDKWQRDDSIGARLNWPITRAKMSIIRHCRFFFPSHTNPAILRAG